jgi:hypothetical protein
MWIVLTALIIFGLWLITLWLDVPAFLTMQRKRGDPPLKTERPQEDVDVPTESAGDYGGGNVGGGGGGVYGGSNVGGDALVGGFDSAGLITAIVTLAVLAACLYVILFGAYDDATEKWAFGGVGSVVGFWLHTKS